MALRTPGGPDPVTAASHLRDPRSSNVLLGERQENMVGHDAVATSGGRARRIGTPVVAGLGIAAVLAIAVAVLVALLGDGTATAQTTDPGPQPYGGAAGADRPGRPGLRRAGARGRDADPRDRERPRLRDRDGREPAAGAHDRADPPRPDRADRARGSSPSPAATRREPARRREPVRRRTGRRRGRCRWSRAVRAPWRRGRRRPVPCPPRAGPAAREGLVPAARAAARAAGRRAIAGPPRCLPRPASRPPVRPAARH